MYKLYKNPEGKINAIQKGDFMWIPMHPDNTDYQQYLAWLAEGNEPLPAEENT